MTEPVSKKQIIGGVEFNKNEIKKSKTYKKDGQIRHSVWIKQGGKGVQIDYPDQTNKNLHPEVKNLGIDPKWYNPDRSNIQIKDIEGATITGDPNQADYITLEGKSKNNTIIVDQKEDLLYTKNQVADRVVLGSETTNNRVAMNGKDKLQIGYKHPTLKNESPFNYVNVEGNVTSDQEAQLQKSLKKDGYNYHKFRQNNPSLFIN